MSRVAGITALALGAAGVMMVKAAGNFQDTTTHLVTDAGESAKNLAMVQAGILQVSTYTATSAANITNAMYHIESGGYHGAAGLTMLKIAAEGARVGGADLDTVSRTLVGTMNAYGMSASHSASFMNQLIATVGAGDMRMQDLASSLSAVAPLAAAAGISFAQVGGAIATMTSQGMSARQASQDLANAIRSLKSPNNVAIKEMQAMGLSSQDVSQHLGQRGLTGTIGMLTQAITSHMGPSGQVIMSTFASAKVAAQDANTEIAAMPRSLQTLAKGFLDGSISAKTWRTDLQGLSPIQAHLMTQFATTAEKAHSFNNLLTSGSPAAQTYTGALAKMMGGATGLNTALMLGGGHMTTFQKNTATAADAAKKAGANVDNWQKIQGTFNFKMDQAHVAVQNTGKALGLALLPAVTSMLQKVTGILRPIAEWTSGHKDLAKNIFLGVTAIAATIAIVGTAAKAYKAITGTLDTVKKGLQLVGIVSKQTAVTEEGAAVKSSGSWIASAAKTVAAWVAAGVKMVAQAAVWVAGNVAKVAVVVASNVAGAVTSAAAWVAANAVMLLGIGLIVVAVVAAVVMIVKHWKQISAEAARVFHDVLSVINSVIGWVKGHWPLLLAILTGPIGMAAYFIIGHWHQILSGAQSLLGSLTGWFRALPGRIVGALASLASMLYNAGYGAMMWLLHGVESVAGSILSYAASLGHDIANAIGGVFGIHFSEPSEATQMIKAGQKVSRGFAAGILAGMSAVHAATAQMNAAAHLGLTAAGGSLAIPALAVGGGAGGGGTTVVIDVHDNHVMSERDLDPLVEKIGRAFATRIGPQSGLRVRF